MRWGILGTKKWVSNKSSASSRNWKSKSSQSELTNCMWHCKSLGTLFLWMRYRNSTSESYNKRSLEAKSAYNYVRSLMAYCNTFHWNSCYLHHKIYFFEDCERFFFRTFVLSIVNIWFVLFSPYLRCFPPSWYFDFPWSSLCISTSIYGAKKLI